MGDMMMSRVTKKMLQASHNKLLNQFAELVRDLKSAKVIGEETCPTFYRRAAGVVEDSCEEPKLKQLDQTVFDGLDEKWRFAAVDKGGEVWVYSGKPDRDCGYWFVKEPVGMSIGKGYDASNWQNSLIERDTAKELLEVDLSSELTGSELCKAMLARGDKYISGFGHHHSDRLALESKFADTVSKHTQCFQSSQNAWDYFVPINNQGEPLTQSDVGL